MNGSETNRLKVQNGYNWRLDFFYKKNEDFIIVLFITIAIIVIIMIMIITHFKIS